MGDALTSHGTLVEIGAIGGGGPYTAIGELADVSGLEMTRNIHEAPNQVSSFIQKVLGMADPGTIGFTVNFLPGGGGGHGHDVLIVAFKNAEVRGWRLTFTDGTQWFGDGGITALTPDNPVDGVATADFTVSLTEPPTI